MKKSENLGKSNENLWKSAKIKEYLTKINDKVRNSMKIKRKSTTKCLNQWKSLTFSHLRSQFDYFYTPPTCIHTYIHTFIHTCLDIEMGRHNNAQHDLIDPVGHHVGHCYAALPQSHPCAPQNHYAGHTHACMLCVNIMGNQWKSMKIYENQWKSMKITEKSMKVYENPWK